MKISILDSRGGCVVYFSYTSLFATSPAVMPLCIEKSLIDLVNYFPN